ncbi:nitric oxide synthase [Plakobranchus ocellatus]|uniref:Nitric oxide synthase n=1 Tax=Plakobranchus ocellatus TaxID=259542 RepID=A0AAV4AQF1_9GAST|nr:nitric oxide synthase [Plakobranchus ocellatus]
MPPTGSPGELSPNTIRVKLVKQAYGGLGFLVKQRTLKPFVLVASIVKGGVAEESGLVQIGDIILRINDIELSDMSYQSAVEVLKAVPIDTPVVLLLRGPEGYTTYLQTSFQENGQPRTVRVTKPVHESLMGRLRKTFSGSSSPISPVKGIKRLCNGEADLKNKPGDGSDMDADSTGGVESGRSSGDGDGGVIYPVVSVEEAGDGLTEDGVAIHRNMSPGYHGNGGLVGVDITGRVARFGDCNNGNDTTRHVPNGAAVKEKRKTYSAASKFAFVNEGRMESEEETVLDNGAVGSPKIVLTSPKNRKDAEKMMARYENSGAATLAHTYDRGVGSGAPVRDRQRKSSTKKAIEIVQDEDEITVVVRGDVNVLSEESSTDPNSPRRFIISTNSKHSGSGGGHGNAKFNGNNNYPNGNDDTVSLGSNGTLYGNKYCNNPYGLASADPEDMVDQEAYKNYGHKNSDGSITSIGTNITISSKEQKTGNFNRVSRSGKKSHSRSSGRSSPSSAGRASPTGRTSRTSVHTSPTRGGEEELGSRRSLDKKR